MRVGGRERRGRVGERGFQCHAEAVAVARDLDVALGTKDFALCDDDVMARAHEEGRGGRLAQREAVDEDARAGRPGLDA